MHTALHSLRSAASPPAAPACPAPSCDTQDRDLCIQGTLPCRTPSPREGGACSHLQNLILAQLRWYAGTDTLSKVGSSTSPAPSGFAAQYPHQSHPSKPQPLSQRAPVPSFPATDTQLGVHVCIKSRVYCHF